jgi:O-antigen/teichoic acid export membrane protein
VTEPSANQAATEQALTRVAKGAGIALSGRAAGSALGYAFSILLGRWLGAGSLGLFSLGLTVTTLAMTLGRFGLDAMLLRFVALYRGEGSASKAKGAVRFALRLSVLATLALTAVLIVSSGVIARAVFHKPDLDWVLRGLAWMMLPGNVALVALATTQAYQVMTYVALTSGVAAPLIQFGVTLILLAMGYGLGSVVVAAVAAQIVAAILACLFARRVMPALSDPQIPAALERGRLTGFAGPMMLVDLTNYLLGWVDLLLLGLYLPAREVGIYHAAARTAGLTTFVLLGINALFAPTMADLFNRNELALLERLFKVVTKWVVTVTLPLFLLCALQGSAILALFGPDFRTAVVPLAVLAAGQLVNAATGSVGYILVMSGRQNLVLVDQIGGLLLAVALNLWMIPRWGVIGAAAASAATLAVINLVRLLQVAVLLRVHPYDAGFARPVIAGAGAAVLSMSLARLAEPLSGALSLGLWMVTFAIAYGSLLIVLGLSREDRMLWLKVRARLGIEAHS